MKRFLLPIAAVALCVAANTASAENPANAVITVRPKLRLPSPSPQA